MSEAAVAGTVALTVHGPSGAVDLLVPASTSVADVAREYVAQSGHRSDAQEPLRLFTTTGWEVPSHRSLTASGVRPGALLIAASSRARATGTTATVPARIATPASNAGSGATAFTLLLTAAAAALAGWLVAHPTSGLSRDLTVALLACAAAVGVLPVGRAIDQRGAAAPTFGAALGFALAWEPGATALPLVAGIAGLGAAVVAGAGRATGAGAPEVHEVWMVAGVATFAVTGLTVLVDWPPQVAWSVLLVVGLLSARSVGALAVNVPDRVLLDLDRLVVTAWSARDGGTPSGPSGGITLHDSGVGAALSRGARIVDASAAAILVVTAVSAPCLLATATYDVDSTGALCLVGSVGAGLLLTARNFRHARARGLLRVAGVVALLALLVHVVPDLTDRELAGVLVASVVLGGALVLVAIAAGRGWRSVGWAARGDLAEAVAGALAIGSLVVSTGLVRLIWEIPFGS